MSVDWPDTPVSPSPARFRLRPLEVNAMRWEPYIPARRRDLLAWLDTIGEPYEVLPAAHAADVRLRLVNTGVASVGSWVVRNRDGRVFAMTARQFAAAYEPVEVTS